MPALHTRSNDLVSLAAAVSTAWLVLAPALLAQGGPTTGPDVTVINIGDTQNYGASGGIRGYSIGTTSCNIGDRPVNWCDNAGGCTDGTTTLNSAQHPVIAQGMYRLLDARFEQIGMSWLKHGFVSTNSTNSACENGHPSCGPNPMGGDQLGVGCTDTYGASLNGSRPLGMRSEVNATTGTFPFPYTHITPTLVYEQRIKVAESDLALPGATYWVEGQYIADNDALAGNGLNNASYRPVTVNASTFNLSFAGGTVREKTALDAWKVADPAVELSNEDFCTAPVERFEVARKVTVVGAGTWHYEYVVRNMNSDHAAQSFAVDFPDGTPISNVGFKSIDHHSGEPYSTTAWTSAVDAATGTVSWSTETYASNNNANALRWATMFNFWFDADAAPATAQHTLDLFKPIIPAVADAGADATICVGGVAHLGTSAIAGQTYSWSPGGATTALIDVSPAVTTDYTVTAANSCATAEDIVRVNVDPGPDAPALVSPADGSTGLQLPVELTWNAVAGAASYTAELATDGAFTQIVQSQTVGTTQASFAGLAPIQYFWRVRANGTCAGVPSVIFDFTVTSAIFADGFELGDTAAWSLTVP